MNILNGDIREHLGRNPILFWPDSLPYGSIPYIIGYLHPKIVTDIKDLNNADTILFSWSNAWQNIAWTKNINQSIIMGGKHVQLLHYYNKLPDIPNISYWLKHIDAGENPYETRVIPDYAPLLQYHPYCDYLMVHSGEGCYWAKCTFCNLHCNESYQQFSAEYVAKCVVRANKHGKAGGLSCNVHTISWLEELESHLPDWSRYEAYIRPDQKGWHRLKCLRKVFIGLEYLSNSVLERVKKGVSVKQITDSILEAQSNGIDVESIVIVDLWETERERREHYQNTLDLLKSTRSAGLGAGCFNLIETRLIPRGWNAYYKD